MEEFKEKSSHQSSWENETANKLIYFLYVFLVKKVTEAVHTFEIKYAKLRQLTQKGEGPQERLVGPRLPERISEVVFAGEKLVGMGGGGGRGSSPRPGLEGRAPPGAGSIIVKGMGSLD